MKKTIFFATLGVLFGAAMAFGQSDVKLKADIPFSFHVRGIHMPADQYEIVQLSKIWQAFALQAHDFSTIVYLLPQAKSTGATDTPKLVFRRYGDEYFLAEMHLESGFDKDNLIPIAKHENEARLGRAKMQGNAHSEPAIVVVNLCR